MADLSLSVQYGITQPPLLTRARLRGWVNKAVEAARSDGLVAFDHISLTLRLVGLAEGRKLNASYRGKDYATNVLTFEYGVQPDQSLLGDVIICVPVLVQEAKAQNKTFLHHAAHLTIHGTLHAIGYDHIRVRDAKRMESLEIATLQRMRIANPYEA